MEINHVKSALEAVLFASGEPVPTARLAEAVGVEEEDVYRMLKLMKDKYATDESGIMLVELGDSFQLCTKPHHAEVIKAALEIKRNMPLSPAALEVLAIIAYNQPVTKSFVEQVRGVDSGQTVNSLVEKGLVEEAGRLDVPGRPISYRTTMGFLRSFGMSSLEGLPPIPDESGQVSLEEVVAHEEQQRREQELAFES